jgi:hypothetical protein
MGAAERATRMEDWAWRHQSTKKGGEEEKLRASGKRFVLVAWRGARRYAKP